MNRKEIQSLLKEIKEVKNKIDNIEKKLKNLLQENQANHKQDNDQINIEELRNKWIEIKQQVDSSDHPEIIIKDFIDKNTKKYIKNFIKINNLNIDPHKPKEQIAKELFQMLKISKIIKEGKPV